MPKHQNENRNLDSEYCHLYMTFKKSYDSAQGMAIYGDEAYMLYHTGMCSVYNLESKISKPIASFKLGSFNKGTPSKEYCNHANQAMFSNIYYKNNPIPLLYVTTGNSGEADKDGYYYRCAVENITKSKSIFGKVIFSSETLQTIIYKNEGISEVDWESPCWGAPAFFVDSDNQAFYILSARYRTTKEYFEYYDQNAFIITRFHLPILENNDRIILTAEDIVDQFTTPFDILFTQGGTLYQNKIYYTFGYGNQDYPIGIRVFDLEKRCIIAKVDLSNCKCAEEEIECGAFYKGKLLCNTNDGNIYSIQEGFFHF